MPKTEIEVLEQATQGLTYPSEKDGEFSVVSWEGSGELTPELIRRLGKSKPKEPVEEISLDEFFDHPTRPADWHGPAEKKSIEQYRQLRKILEKTVSKIKVFRVGKIDITIYVIGEAGPDRWLGLRTSALET